MPRAALVLLLAAFALALPLTLLVRALSRRFHAVDSPGVQGQVKAPRRWVPNTGGIALFWTIASLTSLGLILAHLAPDAITRLVPQAADHLPGIRAETPLALLLLASLSLLHFLGMVDDRRPLGPFLKLALMAIPALAVPLAHTLTPRISDTRLLTLLDAHVAGPWLSILLTALWLLVVTNALNFIDNMDGLAGLVGAVAAAAFLAASLIHAQWFVAAVLALLLGALLAFLLFNFPWREWDGFRGGASIFLGDSGSLVVGFLLAFLSIRITYVPTDADAVPWHAVLTPLVILAVPLYDFASVVLIRLAQGKSPFVGDLQHFSHRIARRVGSRRAAVLVIALFAAATGCSGIILPSLHPWQASLVGAQTLALLAALALFEFAQQRVDAEPKP